MIIEKINEVNERVDELVKAEEKVKDKIVELQNVIKDIENEKILLRGSYNTLVQLGVELGEIEVFEENGITRIMSKKEKTEEEKTENSNKEEKQ